MDRVDEDDVPGRGAMRDTWEKNPSLEFSDGDELNYDADFFRQFASKLKKKYKREPQKLQEYSTGLASTHTLHSQIPGEKTGKGLAELLSIAKIPELQADLYQYQMDYNQQAERSGTKVRMNINFYDPASGPQYAQHLMRAIQQVARGK